jgi:hypothetical protein
MNEPYPLARVHKVLCLVIYPITCLTSLVTHSWDMTLTHTPYDVQESFHRPCKEITRSLRICIIGAGVAGLSTALALRKAGFQLIEVYESATMLRDVGAGIQCAPNMSRILNTLGLLDDLRPHTVSLSGVSIRRELMEPLAHQRI